VDNRNLVWFLSGLAAAGVAVCIAVSCSDQPKTKCTAGRGRFAAVYHPNGELPDGGCALNGEAIGVGVYNPLSSDGTNVDLTRGDVWIKGQSLAEAVAANGPDPNPAHQQNSMGTFATPEPVNDFCNVVNLNPAEQDVPGDDAGTAASTIKYEWSNVRVLVSPTRLGTELVGDLTYTNGCTMNYHVTALFPARECFVHGFCDCLPYADPDPDGGNNGTSGSGLSPDLFAEPVPGCAGDPALAQRLEAVSKVTCVPFGPLQTPLCVLKGDVPQ
jgi:hypothetical protein